MRIARNCVVRSRRMSEKVRDVVVRDVRAYPNCSTTSSAPRVAPPCGSRVERGIGASQTRTLKAATAATRARDPKTAIDTPTPLSSINPCAHVSERL